MDYQEKAARTLAKDLRGNEAEWPSIIDTYPVARLALVMAVRDAVADVKTTVARWFR